MRTAMYLSEIADEMNAAAEHLHAASWARSDDDTVEMTAEDIRSICGLLQIAAMMLHQQISETP